MRRQPNTQILLPQAMILIAAMACGIAAATAQHSKGGGRWPDDTSHFVDVIFGGYWFVPIMSLALLVIEKLSGTTWRELARRPGSVACIAVSSTTILSFANHFILAFVAAARLWKRPQIDLSWYCDSVWVYLPYSAPYAVWASWLVLALAGRWRFVRSWVDIGGILCGLYFATWQWLFSIFG